jgi:hypothetical protein
MLLIMLVVLAAVLVVLLSASVVMMHPLPCRQMTTVHHAGVGEFFQTVSDCRGGLDVCRFPGAQAIGATRRSKWVWWWELCRNWQQLSLELSCCGMTAQIIFQQRKTANNVGSLHGVGVLVGDSWEMKLSST